MESIKRCNVFISSPGDLAKEREYIADILENMKMPGIVFKSIRWEKDLPNTSLSKPQPLIIDQLLSKADILVGIFSTRFGTKTENADSGTVEEIETFIASGKPVIMYFYIQEVSTENITIEMLENLQRINEFQTKYAEKHIYSKIKGIEELKDALERDIEYNMKYILSSSNLKMKKGTSQVKVIKKAKTGKKPWYMDSIADLINKHLKTKGIDFHYRGNLTFHENLQYLTGATNYTAFVEKQFLEEARINAFNEKYGNYNYSEDLRSFYPGWGKQIRDRIFKLNPEFDNKSFRVLDIGGNDGSELESIFQGCSNAKYTVVDISNLAIDKGRKKYKNISFVQNDMEQEYLNNIDLFDICLCLRAIQSRGIFSHDALIQMCKHLNKEGILIVSIPNGYKHNGKVERGLYDHRSRLFLRTKPQELAAKIERKLIDYGFNNTGIETIDTEIIVWGKDRL